MVHHLQQDVEQVGVRFFDFVEQQDAMRMLIHAVCQQPALVEAHIAGRRADQPAYRMALHVFRHVEAKQLDAHDVGQRAGHFGFADAGWTREQIAADRLLRFSQTGARHLDRRGELLDGVVLAEHNALEIG